MNLTTFDERVISLYEISKILGKEHNKAIKLVDELIETAGFGTVEKKAIVYNEKNQTIQTYFFTKRQALIVGGRLDNKNLIKIVDKLEELSKRTNLPTIESNTDKLLEGLLEQGRQTQQLLAYVVQNHSQSQQESELDKQKKQLEIEKLQLEKIAMVADLSTKYKLEQLGNLNDIPSELKQSMAITAGTIVKEVRQAINGVSVTECLKLANISMNAHEFNLLLGKIGILLRVEYQHPYEGTKLSWEVTDDGRYFGYNQHSSSKRKYPVTPKFYSDRFGELIDMLKNENYLN